MVMRNTNKLNGRVLMTVLLLYSFTDDEVLAIRSVKGLSAQLECPFKDKTTLIWEFKHTTNFETYSNRERVSPYLSTEISQRININGNHAEGQYHLNISDIRESDQGTYRCENSLLEKDTQDLIVIVGPKSLSIANATPENKILGIEGQDMIIKCTAVGGEPPPDIKLVIFGQTYTGKPSAQHTIKLLGSYDGSTVTCQAGYADVNYYPLNTAAAIYLMYKPVITSFTDSPLSTEETKSFDVSCTSTGSRPSASMHWLLGQEEHNITSNATSQSYQESTTDKYTVISNLKYRVGRKYNGQKLICRASNVVGYTETSLTFNVTYAPGVTVENKTFSQTQSSRPIQSTLNSNPPVNTCTWRHKSTYGENIRVFSNNNLTLTLPTAHEGQRYQDTGEYICTTENGIIGMNGQLKQKGSGYVLSNAPPVITADNKDNSTQYGKFGKSTKVYVSVYSIPKYSSISWYIGSTQLVSNKYVIKEEPAKVKDVFHAVEVQLDGYRITLTISDLLEVDFTNYTLRLYYGSLYVQHEVTLESASAPQTPSNFTITGSRETSITVQWIAGYDGGQKQTFYIEYRVTGTDVWLPHEIRTSNQLDTLNLYTLSGLQDETSYQLRMYAKNKFNQSQHTDIETIQTPVKANISASAGVIGGVAGGLVVVIVILILIAFVIFKRKAGSGFPNKKTRSHSDSEVEEGLKDNVLYEGSETEGLKVNILYQSAGSDSINQGPNPEYAEVSKPHKKPNKAANDEYAEVHKQNDVYAEVDKKAQQKNVKKKKQKDKKKAPKSAKTRDGVLNNNPDGEHANSGNSKESMSDGAYSNAMNQSTGIKKNGQGLEYADLSFGSKIPKGKQHVIHGDENRTIYSDVDHSKKAPPPPQESEYEETDIRHGKK